MRILIWHVHGSWTTSFVQGRHEYLVPVVPGRGPDGRGRAKTWDWPERAVEVTPEELADAPVDLVVVQQPRDLELAEAWLGGRRLGVDVPVVWVEHNAPQGRIAEMRHPAADRDDLVVVHVTHTNALYWDTGTTPARVIEHGIVDPGEQWTGEVPAAGVVINEPARRGRVTGTDLLPRLGEVGPVELFGMGVARYADEVGRPGWLRVHDDVPQGEMHSRLARCRLYVHPFRWTSLGLSLIEAMHLGMPVVALATTEAHDAVPPSCGVVTNDLDRWLDGVRGLLHDRDLAAEQGRAARRHALARFGLDRFLSDWDDLLEELTT